MNITCLISVYAKANPAHLSEALESIYGQTRKPDEIVLIEDGPLTDELYERINAFDVDPLVVELTAEDDAESIQEALELAQRDARREGDAAAPKLIIGRFATNVLLGRALAAGVHLSSGPLIARMDADDISYSHRFATQLEYLESHEDVDVLGSAIEEFDEEGNVRIKRIPTGESLYAYAKYRCPVNHMTVMMRKEAVLAAGNYHHYPGLEDYELWSRALAKGVAFDNLEEPLVRARLGTNFYDRRGGADYGKRYMALRRQQRKDGLLSASEYLKARIATAIMVYSPAGLRRFIYTILRRERS